MGEKLCNWDERKFVRNKFHSGNEDKSAGLLLSKLSASLQKTKVLSLFRGRFILTSVTY